MKASPRFNEPFQEPYATTPALSGFPARRAALPPIWCRIAVGALARHCLVAALRLLPTSMILVFVLPCASALGSTLPQTHAACGASEVVAFVANDGALGRMFTVAQALRAYALDSVTTP